MGIEFLFHSMVTSWYSFLHTPYLLSFPFQAENRKRQNKLSKKYGYQTKVLIFFFKISYFMFFWLMRKWKFSIWALRYGGKKRDKILFLLIFKFCCFYFICWWEIELLFYLLIETTEEKEERIDCFPLSISCFIYIWTMRISFWLRKWRKGLFDLLPHK